MIAVAESGVNVRGRKGPSRIPAVREVLYNNGHSRNRSSFMLQMFECVGTSPLGFSEAVQAALKIAVEG